jgi:hypothetical protein
MEAVMAKQIRLTQQQKKLKAAETRLMEKFDRRIKAMQAPATEKKVEALLTAGLPTKKKAIAGPSY